jgi:3-oxoacyl-[acyl-carrier-protein] synthase III
MISVQPRKWVPGAIVEALGLNIPAPTTFDRFCHVGGCGIVANLIKAGEEGLLFKGSQTALYAQGAGFTRAAILVEW